MVDVNEADRALLAELRKGPRTMGAFADFTDYSRTHIRTRLRVMEARGWIEYVHEPTALYGLTDDAPNPDELDDP